MESFMKTINNCCELIRRLKNNEHFEFYGNIADFIKGREGHIPEVAKSWKAFLLAYAKEDDIYKKNTKAIETKYINEANQKRSSAYMVIKRSVEAAGCSDSADARDAGARLTEVLRNFRSISSVAMIEVSALVQSMIQDFRKPDYTRAVETLALGSAIDNLEARNEEFRSIHTEKTQNIGASDNKGNMRTIRPVADKAFNALTKAINASHKSGDADTASVYPEIIDFINAYTDQYNKIYARRSSGATGKKDSGIDTETSDAVIPELAVDSQTIIGAGGEDPNRGTQMVIMASDPAAFAQALYPVANGGTLYLTDEEISDYADFPIAGFRMDESGKAPVGLVIDPPRDRLLYNKPLRKVGVCNAEVFKDDDKLVILKGVICPGMEGY
jgi:hypothetical protein